MSEARARELEAMGDVDGAAREFVAAQLHQEAARVFIMAARPLDAAVALLDGIAMIGPDLEAEPKGRVTLAAKLMREGGRDDYAKLMQGALGGGAAFPSAVLKSVIASGAEAPRPSVRAAPAPASPVKSSGTGFVVRAPGASQPGAARPSVEPRAASAPPSSPARPAIEPRTPPPSAPAPTPPPAATPVRPAIQPAPASSGSRPRPAAASHEDADRYKAEAGWHAADGAAIEKTIQQFLETGRKGAAARVAWEAGQFERALPWFVELGLKYQEGSCLRSLGRPVEALVAMLEVAPDDTRYRRACFDVVALAHETGRLDFEVDRFLTPFVSQGPADASECDGFLELAELYASAGFAVGARRCAEGVLAKRPEDARARSLVATGAAPRGRGGSDRPPRRPPTGDLTALPSLDEFVALARKHAPKKPTVRR
jgi:hypothetical protein